MADTTFGPDGWTPDHLGTLAGKTFVITGANAGAGFQVARILLSKGAAVVMLNRSAAKSTRAIADLKQEFGPRAEVGFIRMDLAELASVRAAAEEILRTVPRIDALICNAAIAQVPTRELTVDGFESQLGTNHYGHFVLGGMLFDRIEASMGRIVVVASLGYRMGLRTIQFDDINWDKAYRANPAYSQSKLAQMMFAYELQDRVRAAGRKVGVYVCHPGASATSLISTSGAFDAGNMVADEQDSVGADRRKGRLPGSHVRDPGRVGPARPSWSHGVDANWWPCRQGHVGTLRP